MSNTHLEPPPQPGDGRASSLAEERKPLTPDELQALANSVTNQRPKQFKLGLHSQHKHTVRYSTTDPDAPIDNVYVKRSAFVTMPQAVFVTVTRA